MSHLIEFYGEECPNCIEARKVTKKLEDKEGIKIDRIEIWHNKENMKKMEECDKGECDGVPFFVNTKTGKRLCGEVSYNEFKEWALEEK